MKIVIQCAGSKNDAQPGAGFRAADNRQIKFVASPKLAPHSDQYAYARPDDMADDSQTWRERLMAYNSGDHANPLHLLPAYQLYAGKAYQNLARKFGHLHHQARHHGQDAAANFGKASACDFIFMRVVLPRKFRLFLKSGYTAVTWRDD